MNLENAAKYLAAMQSPDGAFPMAKPGSADSSRVIPYFSSLGAFGLTVAAAETGDRKQRDQYVNAARRWAEWNDSRRNPDGTIFDHEGKSGAWKPTGKYDSTDSYASTYLELLGLLDRVAPNPLWLRGRWQFVHRSVAAIVLTRQPNGLTTATPTYPVMYTMDNIEVLRGLRAAVALAKSLGNKAEGTEWNALADATESGIAGKLWDPKENCYLVGLQVDGGRAAGLSKWYPDVMANLMAVGWLPRSERRMQLYGKLVAKFANAPDTGIPRAVSNEDTLERLTWWGFAARTAGDRTRFPAIQATLRATDLTKLAIANPATVGHVCRLLSRGNVGK